MSIVLDTTILRALSVKQPWASLIADGIKPIENRSWSTSYRGLLLICAGLGSDRAATPEALATRGLHHPTNQPKGVALAVVDLVDVVTDYPSRYAIPGLFHWVLADARKIRPFPVIGRLGIFSIGVDELIFIP